MNRRILLPLVVVSLLLVPACKRSENEAATNTTAPPTDTYTDTVATAGAPLSASDQEFVMKAAKGGMAEVQLGNTVAPRAKSADVKMFAQKMVTDHSAANQELTTFASSRGITLPADLDPEEKALEADLAKLSGAKLDKKYMNAMVEDHEKDVAEFQKASTEVSDPDLKAWATKTLPTLEEHLTMAKDINAKLK